MLITADQQISYLLTETHKTLFSGIHPAFYFFRAGKRGEVYE